MKETFTITPRETALIQQYGLAPEKLQNCSVRSYSFGERIISEGRPNGLLFIITGGKAKVGVTAPNGKNIVLCFYISKGLLGEVELFSDTSAASTTVTAMNELRCIVIPGPQQSIPSRQSGIYPNCRVTTVRKTHAKHGQNSGKHPVHR